MLRQSRRTLDLISKSYASDADSGNVVISAAIRKGQKRLLDELAKYNGASATSTLRSIIDEWCEFKLKEGPVA